MKLDIDVSPPANIMTLGLGLTHLTFDFELLSRSFCLVTDRRTVLSLPLTGWNHLNKTVPKWTNGTTGPRQTPTTGTAGPHRY